GPAPPSDPTLLPARPIVPAPPATGYHVFEVRRDAGSPPADPYSLTLPAALTPEPVPAAEHVIAGPVRFGEERCFVVRAVDTVGGMPVIGRASVPACVTPVDTFPPSPPKQLAAIAGAGVINLIWEPNTEPDLAGYVVLRGEAPDGPLQAVTPSPIRETTYRDQSATPGVRYIYAVVAVDSASPQNVSGQSNRVEESSRTP
ncbi:MAG: fibronectin type III domain-containing protein, partial [Acidobacteriota bacterium]|nr:fibronectin type III domain-containing protein [Acidobacteriota bacterium]